MYIVDRIPGELRIDPQGGAGERQPKKEKQQQRGKGRDSVNISEEARNRRLPSRYDDDDAAAEPG